MSQINSTLPDSDFMIIVVNINFMRIMNRISKENGTCIHKTIIDLVPSLKEFKTCTPIVEEDIVDDINVFK